MAPETLSLLEFLGNRHINVERLSALHTGRLYSPGNISGAHLCQRLSRPQDHGVAGRIKSMKNPCDPKGIQIATLWLVAMCLDEIRHCVPRPFSVASCISLSCLYQVICKPRTSSLGNILIFSLFRPSYAQTLPQQLFVTFINNYSSSK